MSCCGRCGRVTYAAISAGTFLSEYVGQITSSTRECMRITYTNFDVRFDLIKSRPCDQNIRRERLFGYFCLRVWSRVSIGSFVHLRTVLIRCSNEYPLVFRDGRFALDRFDCNRQNILYVVLPIHFASLMYRAIKSKMVVSP